MRRKEEKTPGTLRDNLSICALGQYHLEDRFVSFSETVESNKADTEHQLKRFN